MKYTNWTFRLLTLLLATFLSVAPSRAQSVYASDAPSRASNRAYHAGSDVAANPAPNPTDDADDPQSSILTLHARVNEVNVLFIATDKHGKFVRDL
ncbi:MAG: hypothetical protein ABSG72_22295, partial [Candidatus Sulfotelmatobacter sp.]